MFKIYYIDNCQFSRKALELFENLNININKILVKPQEKNKINTMNKMTTYPQIFYKNNLIGGYDDLVELTNTSKTLYKYMKNKNLSILSDVCKLLYK